MIRGKADFTMDHHTGSSKIHVYLKKMSPSVSKYNYDLRFESVEEAHSAAQQAAIAIDMKKKGKKPKNEAQGTCWDGYEQRGMKKKVTRWFLIVYQLERKISKKKCPYESFIMVKSKVTCKI